MPEPRQPHILRLTPPILRTALLFAASLIWLGFGAYLFSLTRSVLPLALATLGLVGAVIYGLTLLPGSSYLEATPQGLTVSVAFRKRTHPWVDVGEFAVRPLGRKKKLVRYRLLRHDVAAPDDVRVDRAARPRRSPARHLRPGRRGTGRAPQRAAPRRPRKRAACAIAARPHHHHPCNVALLSTPTNCRAENNLLRQGRQAP